METKIIDDATDKVVGYFTKLGWEVASISTPNAQGRVAAVMTRHSRFAVLEEYLRDLEKTIRAMQAHGQVITRKPGMEKLPEKELEFVWMLSCLLTRHPIQIAMVLDGDDPKNAPMPHRPL